MKKSFMTRALATGLSLAMAFSLSAATNVTTAAAAVTVKQAAMKSSKINLEVGQTKNYHATSETKAAKNITISKVKISNAAKAELSVKRYAKKKYIAVTGIAATAATRNVVVTFKNTKTKKTATVTMKATVKEAEKPDEPVSTTVKITAIKQEKASNLTATFSADVTGVTTGAIKVVRDETNAVVTVKSITVDKNDNTKAAIETYESLADGKAYTVTYVAADGTESSATFTATDGSVADIALNTYSIPANTPTEIKYQTLDANGVVIAEAGIGSSKANYMDISVENANGYQNNNELLLYKPGDTATIKAVYHTFKYNNTNGTEEGKVEKSFTITAVDQSTVIETFDYTVAKRDDEGTIDFKHDKLIKQVAIDDDKNGAEPTAFFSFRTADGKDITGNLDYSVSSGNENVLLASGTVAGGAMLTPVASGATYLVIKNASGAVVTTLPITVVAKRTLSTMTVDNPTVTIGAKAAAVGNQKITVKVMDQYSDPYTNYAPAPVPELKSNNSPGTLNLTAAQDLSDRDKTIITVTSGGNANPGTYVYTLDLVDQLNANNTKKISFTVIVSTDLDINNATYALVMMNGDEVVSKVDTTVTRNTFNPILLKPTIVAKNNGSIKAEVIPAAIADLRLSKNGVPVSDAAIYDRTATAIANASIFVATGSGVASNPIDKKLEPGTYTVTFTATLPTNNGGTTSQNMATSFIVEDSQREFAATVNKESVTTTNVLKGVFESTDYVTFTYAGEALKAGTYEYASSKYTNINNNMLNVSKATMNVTLPGTDRKHVLMTADINKTFTFTNGVMNDEMAADAKAESEAKVDIDLANVIADLSSIDGVKDGVATKAAIAVSTAAISGSSITVTASVSAAAISGGAVDASALSGGKFVVSPSADSLYINIIFPDDANVASRDHVVITYTVTVTNNESGVSVSKSESVDVTYTYDGSKWDAS